MAAPDDYVDEESYAFVYGDEAIRYWVHRKPVVADRRRQVTIRVHPDSRVVVSAPDDATQSAIHSAVCKRARWVWANLTDFRAQVTHVQPKRYISGEMLFYLGRRYVLKVTVDKTVPGSARMQRGQLQVRVPSDGAARPIQARMLVRHWYTVRAKAVFTEGLQRLVPRLSWVSAPPPFRVLPMSKQWGSCSAKGTLLLNPHLVKAPRLCIDYVILHELCHLAEHNHSPQFYRLLDRAMPDWREVKTQLDDMAELYLSE